MSSLVYKILKGKVYEYPVVILINMIIKSLKQQNNKTFKNYFNNNLVITLIVHFCNLSLREMVQHCFVCINLWVTTYSGLAQVWKWSGENILLGQGKVRVFYFESGKIEIILSKS